MIHIKKTDRGISMEGHAGCQENGHDIVCAAVSALTCNLVNSLGHFTDTVILQRSYCSGRMDIQWLSPLSDRAQLLVDSWHLGLEAINQEYNCITFE